MHTDIACDLGYRPMVINDKGNRFCLVLLGKATACRTHSFFSRLIRAANPCVHQTGNGPHQRRAMSPLCQFFTLVEWFRQIEIIDSIQFVLRRVRARVGGTPRRSTVSVSLRPSRRLPAAPGCVCSNSLASASSWASAMIADGAW